MRSVVDNIYAAFREQSANVCIANLTIGLGYTAVETTDGDVGLSYTMIDRPVGCTKVRSYRNYQGLPATVLLEHLRSNDTLDRSMGVATVNALNRRAALSLPADDKADGGFVRVFGVGCGTRVAMVGFFGPVVARLKDLGAEVSILDRDRAMGDERRFLAALDSWPDVLVVTATTLLNGSLEWFLERVREPTKVLVLGPSTPLVPAAYRSVPVDMLAGMVPVELERVTLAVRQGAGTPELMPFCRKVYWTAMP